MIEFVRYHAMLTSVELAQEPRPLPGHPGQHLRSRALALAAAAAASCRIRTIGAARRSIGRRSTAGIRQHGIRNAAQTTIAPTGTIATVAGCEGYGCEPVFALAYIRHVNDNGNDLQLTYTSPQFEQALELKPGIDGEAPPERWWSR